MRQASDRPYLGGHGRLIMLMELRRTDMDEHRICIGRMWTDQTTNLGGTIGMDISNEWTVIGGQKYYTESFGRTPIDSLSVWLETAR